MRHYQYSLVLPTYNAAALLDDTWRQLAPFAAERRDTWEILFVCDGCTDNTVPRLQELTAGAPNVRVISCFRNAGKGRAVRVGLRQAVGRYRIFTDVDLAYPLAMVDKLAAQLAAGHDVVVASRAAPESQIHTAEDVAGYHRRRQTQSRAFRLLATRALGIQQSDTQAGLKGMSQAAAAKLLPQLKCNGFGFDCELLMLCRIFGIRVFELPVDVHYTHRHSTTNLSTALTMIQDIAGIRRRGNMLEKRLAAAPAPAHSNGAPAAIAPQS